jgi:N-methylhydantoinase B
VDTVFRALAPAIPDRVIAGHHADLLVAQFHGFNPKTSEFFMGNFGPLGGGWGAKRSEDGVSGTVAINDGDTHNSPNEQIEAKFPLVVERYALVPDSGGAGRYRGGLGVERVVRARTDITLNTQIERQEQFRGAALWNPLEDRVPECQGTGRADQGRRCIPPAFRRWRRLRFAIRSTGGGRTR